MKVILEDDLVDSCKSGKDYFLDFETTFLCCSGLSLTLRLEWSSVPPPLPQQLGLHVASKSKLLIACVGGSQ